MCRDWTAQSVPAILTADTVTIINPAGQPLTVYNPFREYRFPVRIYELLSVKSALLLLTW
jgi:hypothetical protein